jgi:hypothetical protein
LAEVQVADGRIFVIEALTYGTNHAVGHASALVERFGPWMPKPLRDLLSPKVPQTSFTLSQPALVVWVHALDGLARTNVDCQGIRLEFEDEHGDLWGQRRSGHHSFEGHFNRGYHVFEAFPRKAGQLTLNLTPWRGSNPVSVTLPNPHPTRAENWSGLPVPQILLTNGIEIVLAGLSARTNGAPDRYWETPSRYWAPEWKLERGGEPASGWQDAEWEAFDPHGNRGQFLGLNQPVLRYRVSYQPYATNAEATTPLVALPPAALDAMATNSIWLRTSRVESIEVVATGLMTTRMNFFTDGVYQRVAPVPIGPTRGGAPTGWVSSSKRVSPVKVVTHRGHYADRPVVYLQCADPELAKRLGVRVRDEQGRLWPTTRETQGNPDGIIPFMLDVPPEVTNVVAEIVRLNPVGAEFTVRTPTPIGTMP